MTFSSVLDLKFNSATEFKSSNNELSPILKNFKIISSHRNRIYFESSKSISGESVAGFVIGDRKIKSVHINDRNTSGHYFLVDTPFNFWDNTLIRYDGKSDIADRNGNLLRKFNLNYIENDIEEPKSTFNYYVSPSGNDLNNGLSEDNSWKTISKACRSVSKGSTIWVKGGEYINENIVFQNSGTVKDPIKIIGYKNKPGDAIILERTIGMDFKSSELPILSGKQGSAISTSQNDYILIKNLQIQNYPEFSIHILGSNFINIENCYFKNGKFGVWTQNGDSQNNRVSDSYFCNFSKNALKLSNKNNLINNTWSVSSRPVGQDYYINIRGGIQGTNNIVRNCFVERYPSDTHKGHGITLKAAKIKYQSEYNLVENCEIVNVGGALEFRHSGTKFNVARNLKIRETEPKNSGGIKFRDGTSNNIVENSDISGHKGIEFRQNSKEDLGFQIGGSKNQIINTVFHDLDYAIFINDVLDGNVENKILNCTFSKIDFLFTQLSSSKALNKFDDSNMFVNCILENVNSNIKFGLPSFIMNYTNFYKSFTAPEGEGNISSVVILDENYILLPGTSESVLKGGKTIDVFYDKLSNERTVPYSMGAIEKD